VQWIMINGRKLAPIAVDPGHHAPAGKRRHPPRHQSRLLPCRSLCLPVLLAHQGAPSWSSLSVEARQLTDTKHFSCRCTWVGGLHSLMGIKLYGVEARSAGFEGPERLLVRVFMLHVCCLTRFFLLHVCCLMVRVSSLTTPQLYRCSAFVFCGVKNKSSCFCCDFFSWVLQPLVT